MLQTFIFCSKLFFQQQKIRMFIEIVLTESPMSLVASYWNSSVCSKSYPCFRLQQLYLLWRFYLWKKKSTWNYDIWSCYVFLPFLSCQRGQSMRVPWGCRKVKYFWWGFVANSYITKSIWGIWMKLVIKHPLG